MCGPSPRIPIDEDNHHVIVRLENDPKEVGCGLGECGSGIKLLWTHVPGEPVPHQLASTVHPNLWTRFLQDVANKSPHRPVGDTTVAVGSFGMTCVIGSIFLFIYVQNKVWFVAFFLGGRP